MSNSQKDRPYLFSEAPPILDVNNWIKIFSVMWLTYLLFNTNNPLSDLLNPSGVSQMDTLDFKSSMLIIGGGLLYASLISFGIIWGGRVAVLKKLFKKFHWYDLLLIVWYSALYIVFQVTGNYLTAYLPATFDVDAAQTLDGVQLQTLDVLIPASIRMFFIVLGNTLISICLFLALYQLSKHYLKDHRWIRIILTYSIACLIAGALTTTPINAHLILNMITGGLAQLPLYWAYRRTRNVWIPFFSSYLVNRLIIFMIIWINISN